MKTARLFFLFCTLLLCAQARASEWVYEFSFGYKVAAARAVDASCHKLVPLVYVQDYAVEPRDGWTISCGGDNPIYHHKLGVKCAQPLPKLELWCLWEHMSHAWDHTETHYDAFTISGRFEWGTPGKRRRRR